MWTWPTIKWDNNQSPTTTVSKVKDRWPVCRGHICCHICKSQGGLIANVKLHFWNFASPCTFISEFLFHHSLKGYSTMSIRMADNFENGLSIYSFVHLPIWSSVCVYPLSYKLATEEPWLEKVRGDLRWPLPFHSSMQTMYYFRE